jgi:hypothetical protein
LHANSIYLFVFWSASSEFSLLHKKKLQNSEII